jgi:hypothetical protein
MTTMATRIWNFNHGRIEDFKGTYEAVAGAVAAIAVAGDTIASELAATSDADPAPLAVFKDFDVTISRIDKQLFMLCGR